MENTHRKTSDNHSDRLMNIRNDIKHHIIGQEILIDNLLICLLADGHILIEGMPGLAKTTAAKIIAQSIEGNFHRIQFTPDLLPSDLIGTEIYHHESELFKFRAGPLFNNIVLVDEINRASAKVQSALLEAMAEKQVTIGHKTHLLPELYMVLATQNPIDQEGTYNLPEAQLDRFLMHINIDYPTLNQELEIIDLEERKLQFGSNNDNALPASPITTQAEIFAARNDVNNVFISPALKNYIASLVIATRDAKKYDNDLHKWIMHGASPRASLALIRCSKACAWLDNAEYVTPSHIHRVAPYILSHRIILTFEAEALSVSKSQVISRLLSVVAIP